MIKDQFRTGSGGKKVLYGEYDLYDMTTQVRKITSRDPYAWNM